MICSSKNTFEAIQNNIVYTSLENYGGGADPLIKTGLHESV